VNGPRLNVSQAGRPLLIYLASRNGQAELTLVVLCFTCSHGLTVLVLWLGVAWHCCNLWSDVRFGTRSTGFDYYDYWIIIIMSIYSIISWRGVLSQLINLVLSAFEKRENFSEIFVSFKHETFTTYLYRQHCLCFGTSCIAKNALPNVLLWNIFANVLHVVTC